MKLTDYLQAIRECPDEQLHTEWGIYDNFPIFIKGSWKEFIQEVIKSEKWKINPLLSKKSHMHFNFVGGGVIGQTENYIPSSFTSCHDNPLTPNDQLHHKSQRERYDFYFMLHPANKKRSGVAPKRALANALEQITRMLHAQDVPLCLPWSNGWNHQGEYGRVVYSPDTHEEKIMRDTIA